VPRRRSRLRSLEDNPSELDTDSSEPTDHSVPIEESCLADPGFRASVLLELLSLKGVPEACSRIIEREDLTETEARRLVARALGALPEGGPERSDRPREIARELRERAGIDLKEQSQRRTRGATRVSERFREVLEAVMRERFPYPPGGGAETAENPA
jgi:hypothetical protein